MTTLDALTLALIARQQPDYPLRATHINGSWVIMHAQCVAGTRYRTSRYTIEVVRNNDPRIRPGKCYWCQSPLDYTLQPCWNNPET